MEYRENGQRFYNYHKWESVKLNPYDYQKNGLIKHILSKKIVYTKNHILKTILIFYEQTIIFLLKYIDRLKHFKNYHWRNR